MTEKQDLQEKLDLLGIEYLDDTFTTIDDLTDSEISEYLALLKKREISII